MPCHVLPPNLAPRGVCRVGAASYIGVSASKFDELVADGRMPLPKRVDSRKIWDVKALDRAFEALPEDGEQTACQRRSKNAPVGRSKNVLGDVMRRAPIGALRMWLCAFRQDQFG
jgi:hypothetical protein